LIVRTMHGVLLTITLAIAAIVCDQTPSAGATSPVPQQRNVQQMSTLKIRITIEGTPITATVADNATTRDFLSLLPLTLTLKDYASTEKISDLPMRLSTDGAPAAMDPHTGDITYYAPWGTLAIFYKDGHLSDGLVKLGTIDAGLKMLDRRDPFEVTIEPEVSP
jgi:hypothetical protein